MLQNVIFQLIVIELFACDLFIIWLIWIERQLYFELAQEAKESFASPNYLFSGKSHIVNQLYCKNGCKKPFLFAFNTTTRGNGQKWNPAQIDAQTTLFLPMSHLSGFI